MGSRSVNFNFTPGENEQIETVITIPEERRSIIHGVVKNHCNKVVKDAIVKLYECTNHHDDQSLKPITHTFTDDCGQFVFGPLWACKDYVIKVWLNDVKIRELIIHPVDCDPQKDVTNIKVADISSETSIEDELRNNQFFLRTCIDDKSDDLDD